MLHVSATFFYFQEESEEDYTHSCVQGTLASLLTGLITPSLTQKYRITTS